MSRSLLVPVPDRDGRSRRRLHLNSGPSTLGPNPCRGSSDALPSQCLSGIRGALAREPTLTTVRPARRPRGQGHAPQRERTRVQEGARLSAAVWVTEMLLLDFSVRDIQGVFLARYMLVMCLVHLGEPRLLDAVLLSDFIARQIPFL